MHPNEIHLNELLENGCLRCGSIVENSKLIVKTYFIFFNCEFCDSEYTIILKSKLLDSLKINLEKNHSIYIRYYHKNTSIYLEDNNFTIQFLIDPKITLEKLKKYLMFM